MSRRAKVDDLLATAKELLEQIALAEAEKAAESMRKRAEAEEEKKRLLDTFAKPSLSDEDALRQGIAIIQRAANTTVGMLRSRPTVHFVVRRPASAGCSKVRNTRLPIVRRTQKFRE